MHEQGEWLIPFQGRKESYEYEQCFVWQHGNVYIMDNHRAAFWCWGQHLSGNEKYNLLHIDRHYDLPPICIDARFASLPDPRIADIRSTLDSSFPCPTCPSVAVPILSWDNYLRLFMWKFPGIFETCVFSTHREEMRKPDIVDPETEWEPYDLARVHCLFARDRAAPNLRWICSVDLDYFFVGYDSPTMPGNTEMFSKAYLTKLFSAIAEALKQDRIAVFTMALSPECCGGWTRAANLADRICTIMDIPFRIPD